MDKVRKIFDEWAQNGRAELMETEHRTNVLKILQKIPFDKPFTFLDVGCGNGWIVRKIANEEKCKKVTGIDKSKKMIIEAKKRSVNKKEEFIYTDIESMNQKEKFNFIFSMESLYYVNSVDIVLKKIFKLLKPGGQFFCGTDFYTDNKATVKWADMMKIKMHLYSKKEWKLFFQNAGFTVNIKRIRDLKSRKKWKREFGTLFIIGTKPVK